MIGWTLCSGIGAPEVAIPEIDWRLASEIEPFPRAVLQERFGYVLPDDHHQGDPLLWSDMTEVTPELARRRGVPLPDILVAGTPCQAFSVAGARKGTEDPRGNLTLAFVETCHAVADARPDGTLAVLWENVPGVLSDNGNAFGCFLGGLVGAMDALPPPGDGSWPSEGMVEGPRARAAWAVLDSQWFGVAQRRRRVFVVVDFGDCLDPAAVLLEPDRLRGNPPSRGKAGEGAAAGLAVGTSSGGDGHVAPCLETTSHDHSRSDGFTMVAHALRGEGFDASEDGTGRGTPLVPVSVFDPNQVTSKANRSTPTPELSHTLPATANAPVAFRSTGNCGVQETGDCVGALTTSTDPNAQFIAFSSKDHGADATFDLSPTLRASGHTDSHANAGAPPAVATAYAVRRLMPVETARLQAFPDDHTAITYRGKPAADGPQYKAHGNSMTTTVVRYIMERMVASMEAHR